MRDVTRQEIFLRHAPILLFTLGVFLFALRPSDSFDTFWQLKTGEHIFQTGSFLYHDTFSLAADAPRIEHCWLHDLVLYALFSAGGFVLLALLVPVVMAACGAILLRWNLRQGVRLPFAVPVLALCLAASAQSWLVRPHLWTFLFSILYLVLLYRGREDGGRSWLWLAPVMLLWANLHAGCIFGLVLIGLFGAGELVRLLQGQTRVRSIGLLAGAGGLAFAASFLNPYGHRIPLGGLLFHMNQHQVLTGDAPATLLGNMEWLPPTFAQVPLFYLVMVLWGTLILLRLRRIDPVEGILYLAFLYMGLSQIRHTTLVALLAGFYLPLGIQDLADRYREHSGLSFGRFSRSLLWGGGGLLVAGLLLYQFHTGLLGLGLRDKEFPVAATDFLREGKLPGQIYNSYDWGGYLLWRLYPEHLVFVDGRQDSPELFHDSRVIDNLWNGWEATLNRYGINTVITRTCYYDTGGPVPLVEGLVQHPAWALVYQDDVALIFLRRSEETRPLLEQELPKWKAYETMLAESDRLYRDDSSRVRALLARGKAQWALGRADAARTDLVRFLEKEPGNAEAAFMVSFLQKPR